MHTDAIENYFFTNLMNIKFSQNNINSSNVIIDLYIIRYFVIYVYPNYKCIEMFSFVKSDKLFIFYKVYQDKYKESF